MKYPRMPELYQKWSQITGSADFTQYFKTYILKDLVDGMLAGVRRAAGLGENFLYTNAVESTHSKYKRRIWQNKSDSQKSGKPSSLSSWTEAACEYIEMTAEHFRNWERAIIDEGKTIFHNILSQAKVILRSLIYVMKFCDVL